MVERIYPVITIGGLTISPNWDDSAAVALDDYTIKWGREQVYDYASSAQLVMKLLDPNAVFGNNSMFGAEVVITVQPYGFVQYRGHISDIELRPIVADGSPTWEVTVTANDVLADLARFVPYGVRYAANTTYGWDPIATHFGFADYYSSGYPSLVITDGIPNGPNASVMAQCISRGLLAGIEVPRNWPVSGGGSSSNWYQMGADTVEVYGSALDQLQRVSRLIAGGHVNWDADARWIRNGWAAVAGLLALAYTPTGGHPGVIYIAPQAGNPSYPVFSIPADQVMLTDDVSHSTVAQNITEIEYVFQQLQSVLVTRQGVTTPASGTNTAWMDDSDSSKISYIYAVPGAVTGVVTRLTFDTGLWWSLVDRQTATAAGLHAEWWPFVQSINGKLTQPGLRFDLHRFTYPAAFEQMILKPMSDRRPLYFPGSQYAELTALATQHQAIGGTIGYRGGFYAEPVLAPAGLAPGATQLTIGQLVTNQTPVMGEYDPAISLADWGTISIGLS